MYRDAQAPDLAVLPKKKISLPELPPIKIKIWTRWPIASLAEEICVVKGGKTKEWKLRGSNPRPLACNARTVRAVHARVRVLT